MKVYGGSGSIAPRILGFGTKNNYKQM